MSHGDPFAEASTSADSYSGLPLTSSSVPVMELSPAPERIFTPEQTGPPVLEPDVDPIVPWPNGPPIGEAETRYLSLTSTTPDLFDEQVFTLPAIHPTPTAERVNPAPGSPLLQPSAGFDQIALIQTAQQALIPMARLRISYSMIADWLACHYRWHLRYERGLSVTARKRVLDIGSAVHLALEYVLHGQTVEDGLIEFKRKALARLDPLLEDLVEDTAAVLEPFVDEARIIAHNAVSYLDLSQWETVVVGGVPLIEYEMETPVDGFRSFVGKVDWVARDLRTGYNWLFEFKTRGSFHDDTAEEVDLQKATYQYLLMERGIETTGSITFQMLSTAPKVPTQNKDGKFSRMKIATDWPTYAEAVRAAGQDPGDYTDMLDKLGEIEWFRLSKSMRGPTEISNVWHEIVLPVAKAIARDDRTRYRNMNHFTCRNCDFRPLCMAALRGHDTDYIARTLYTRYVPS